MENPNSIVVPGEVFKVGSFVVTETMFTAAVTTAVLILFALVVRIFLIPRWEKEYVKKSGLRIMIEYLINMFDNNAEEQSEKKNSGFTGAFYFATAAFICISTLMELFSLRAPLSDMSLTITFGLMTFIIIVVLGFKKKKARRLLHYANPLYTLTDAVVPFSIALRMFGSVFSGYLVLHLVYDMLPQYLLVGIPAIVNVLFTLFHALIQSYVYMFLSLSLINEAMETDEKPKKLKKLKN